MTIESVAEKKPILPEGLNATFTRLQFRENLDACKTRGRSNSELGQLRNRSNASL